MAKERNGLVQSVERALDILDVVSEEGALRPTDIAERVGLQKQTTYNLQRTLQARGYLTKNGDGKICLGPRLIELAAREQESRIRLRAVTAAVALAELPWQPVVNYTELCDDRLFVRVRLSPDRPCVVQRPVGQMLSPYTSASGIVFLAYLPLDRAAHLLEKDVFQEQMQSAWKSDEELAAFLDDVRKLGYCELPLGKRDLYRVAAPVLIPKGHLAGVIGVASPARLCDAAAETAIRKAVCAAAREIGSTGP